jgi:tetratricopeptide (TPR) repeat protein
MIKILFLAANPSSTDQLRLGAEARAIKERLRLAEYRDDFVVEEEWAVRVTDLQAHLLRHRPHIVHFSGHGSSDGQIILEDQTGHSNPITASALSRLFAALQDNIRCVVLNACFSEAQAGGIVESVDCVIGMTRAIEDPSAIAFAASFYQALGYGRSIQTAFELGCNEIELEREGSGAGSLLPGARTRDFELTRLSPPKVDIPKLICASGVDPSTIHLSARGVIDPRRREGSSLHANHQGDSAERRLPSMAAKASTSALVQAALHKLESGDDEEAILFATQVLASDPDSVEAHYVMGLARTLQGDMQAAKAAFEKALQFNPDHCPSLFGAAITSIETSGPARETAERVNAEHWLRHLMELEPPHQRTHRAAKRLLDELADYRPTVRESDPSEIRKKARRALYLRIREGHQSGGMRIRSWLEALPPWSIIARLPVPAAIGSLVFAALPYALVLACNIPAWSLLFILKFGMITVINFLGYWHAFLVSRMLNYHLGKLRTKTHAPGDKFEMWCLEKVASFWGSINLGYPLRSTQNLVKLPPIDAPFRLAVARARAAFSEFLARLGRDRQIVSTYIVLFVLLTPVNIWCAADHFSASSAAVSRYMMYVLEGYSALWSFHLVCALLILAPGIIREFLEADIGTTPSLSVAPLGHLYLGLGLLATYSYGVTLVQHYLWQTHVTARHAAITLNVVCAVFTLVALLAPQVFITLALCDVKDRRLAKFSVRTDDRDVLEAQEKDRLFLKRTLSIWWFDVRSFLGLAILTCATIIMVSVYLYCVINHIWVFA